MEKVYVVTTCVENTEEQVEVINRIVKITKNGEIAKETMEFLVEEVKENYDENNFAYSEDETENVVVITREDMLEKVTIEITEMGVE